MKENVKYGWIGLYRSMKSHWLYPKNNFTKYEAWIDLLLMVNHKDNKVFNGVDTEICKRGETFTSQKKLMSRWGWSKSKLIKFLEVLRKEKMIEYKSCTKKTTLKVLNFVDYQDFESIEKLKKDHKKTVERLQKDFKKTLERLQKDTNNNDKEIKNSYSESEFLKDWKKVREFKTNQTTNINKLTQYELNDFNTLKKEFTKQQFQDAMLGLFEQKNMFPANKLRPTHFLRDRNIEKYLDCKTNNKQLFEEKQNKL